MNLLTRFQEKVGFTRNETRTIAILAVTFLIGSAIRAYRQHGIQSDIPRYDYTRTDSVFSALSHRADSLERDGISLQQTSVHKVPLAGERINLNTATMKELIHLPGIGPTYAQRILDDRRQRGPFSSVEDLLRVKGIGKKKLEKLRAWVRVSLN